MEIDGGFLYSSELFFGFNKKKGAVIAVDMLTSNKVLEVPFNEFFICEGNFCDFKIH